MDQDSFRKLLETPRANGPAVLGGGSRSRISLAAPPPKKRAIDASQTAFKPRTVKKAQDSKYRDRASERRVGDGNDYAHVEAVLEEFEKRNGDADKETVDAQRKYLGGDGEHSVLVKGLDFALLEQNKARAVLTSEDIDALDEAYKEASTQERIIPKKRNRDDILRELKEARAAGKVGKNSLATKTAEEEARLLEEAKQKGKFKPIGFKPVGSSTDGKKKRANVDDAGGEKKKKKVRIDSETAATTTVEVRASTSMPPPPVPVKPIQEGGEPFDDNFDIFADAGEYNPLDFDNDDDEISHKPATTEDPQEGTSSKPSTRWIPTEEPEKEPPNVTLPASGRSASPRQPLSDADDDVEDQRPMRLVPLSSSAVPSIKDLLAMDKAAGAYAKNKKRKDKKKTSDGNDEGEEVKKRSLEEKVDRDYKRLKTYTDKKAAAENS